MERVLARRSLLSRRILPNSICMLYNASTMKRKPTCPSWLKPGALVWCGFVAVVREVAVSDNTILVKVESPKRTALGQREEWLPYYPGPGTLKRATRKQLQADISLYRNLLQQRVAEFDRIAGELTGYPRNGRS